MTQTATVIQARPIRCRHQSRIGCRRSHQHGLWSKVIEQLDTSALSKPRAGRDSTADLPELLLGTLLYGYATGLYVFEPSHRTPPR